MAFVTINGVRFDTEDVDLLVMYCPLASLRKAVEASKETLTKLTPDDKLRPYFEHRLEAHVCALDIAEIEWENGLKHEVKTIQESREKQYNINEAIAKEARQVDAATRTRKSREKYQLIKE